MKRAKSTYQQPERRLRKAEHLLDQNDLFPAIVGRPWTSKPPRSTHAPKPEGSGWERGQSCVGEPTVLLFLDLYFPSPPPISYTRCKTKSASVS
jgi:hypothetical protein